YQRGKIDEAAQLYMGLEKAARANDLKGIRETSGPLMDKYGATPYGPMAALVAAKANYDAGDAASATAQLQWAVDHSRDDDTAAIARLRLAGVLLDQKKYDDALKLLDASHASAFDGLYADRRGDVYVAQDKKAEARDAYKQAIDKLPKEGSYRDVVEVKLDALGGAK
ncbi:MAG: tetratricopeptide repeat protein, partial [Betaproteobacteria bacterium]